MLIAITSPEKRPTEVEDLNTLFEAGLESLHLRKPAFSKEEYEEVLKGIAPIFKRRVVLHQYHELASKYNIKGVHLREESRNKLAPETLKELKINLTKRNLTFSSSLHSIEDIKKFDGLFDYVFLSPVFDSISKPGYSSVFRVQGSELGVQSSKLNVQSWGLRTSIIALGGITKERIKTVKEWGFDGVAVLGAIWQNTGESTARFEEIKQEYLQQFNNSAFR